MARELRNGFTRVKGLDTILGALYDGPSFDCSEINHMTHKVARTGLMFLFALLIAVPFPLLAQDQSDSQAVSTASAQDAKSQDAKGKDKDKDKKKDKDKDKKTPKKPKNADVDNIGTRDINKGSVNLFSLDKEIAMGRQIAADIERQVKLVDDTTINEYVNRIGQNIVRNSDAKVPFTIKVVESDEINAFALPGGFFYVNSGLILAADDESELAGVMAHEIAHVAARHGTKQQSKAEIVNIASIPLIFLGGVGGFAMRQAAGLLIPMGFLQFSRSDEAEADYLGLQYMYKAGYDPTATVSFFEKLQARESAKPGSVSKMFSTHPPTGDRIEMDKKNIELILPDKDQYVVTTSEFNRVKAQLAQLENRKPSQEESNKPSLRRRTPRPDPNGKDKGDTGTSSDDDSDRPTLKRSPSASGSGSDKSSTDASAGQTSSSSKTQTKSSDSTNPDDQSPSDDDRPKLKHREQP
jgi:predicted Zn-dependent protease